MNIAVDIGARHSRVAAPGADGVPRLVDLPGTVAGEGLPLSAAAAGSWPTALRETYERHRERYGPAERVVVVVPPHTAARRATETAEVFAGLADPVTTRVLSAPVAVLALLRHRGVLTDGPYLVCDLGARGAEFSLAAVVSRTVAVVSSQRTAVAGGLGTAFEEALLRGAGLPADVESRAALAAAWRQEGIGQRLTVAVDRASSGGADVFASTVVLRVLGRDITAGVVRDAWQPVADAMDRLTDSVAAGAREPVPVPPGASGPPSVVVGGLARLPLAARHFAGRGRLARLPGDDDPALAAVRGGALVAAGLVDPGDRYPHSVSVRTHGVVAGLLRSADLVLAAPDALEPGGRPVFAEHGGRPVVVRTAGDAGGRPVDVAVRPAGGGCLPVRTVPLPAAPGERWHVGVRLAVGGEAHLVLRPAGDGTATEYPLGILPITTEGALP